MVRRKFVGKFRRNTDDFTVNRNVVGNSSEGSSSVSFLHPDLVSFPDSPKLGLFPHLLNPVEFCLEICRHLFLSYNFMSELFSLFGQN
ncbi:hypothetical protein F2Q70_00043955 [Brassica cretica]|uniref:Uncharacterized protein n=1 Tax=Brassica cretica TaxID=69181 RepID=A0A8S9KM74_BRACR|nr:hypothetical protein F2Q70_00043955 [Brassica cretica]